MKKSEIYRLAAIAVAAADNRLISHKDKAEVVAELAREQFVNEICEEVAAEKAAEAEKAEDADEELQ